MYTLGIAYRLSHDLLISGEITYNQWSDFLSPSLEIHTDLKVPIIPIQLLPGVVEDPNFSDTWTPRIGVEYRGITKKSYNIIFRTGYAYDPSPVPEQTGWSNFLDGNKHIFSTGLGLELKELFGKDLSNACPALQGVFQYQWIQKTHHQKLPSVNPLIQAFPLLQERAKYSSLDWPLLWNTAEHETDHHTDRNGSGRVCLRRITHLTATLGQSPGQFRIRIQVDCHGGGCYSLGQRCWCCLL